MPRPPVEPSSRDTTATIFVVDPDILARMVIADYLRDCGYKVVEGLKADDALAILQAGMRIGVILTEVQLAKQAGESQRGRHNQSIEPLLPTRAAVSQSPIKT